MDEEGSGESTLYSNCKLCETLVDSLDVLISSDRLPPEMGLKVLEKFNEAIHAGIEQRGDAKATIKGTIESYGFVDNIWKFKTRELRVKYAMPSIGYNSPELVVSEPVLITCEDVRVRQGQI